MPYYIQPLSNVCSAKVQNNTYPLREWAGLFFYKPNSCFFLASNSSLVIIPSSANFLNFLISSAGSVLAALTVGCLTACLACCGQAVR